MWCKFGHLTPQNLGSMKPSYSTEGLGTLPTRPSKHVFNSLPSEEGTFFSNDFHMEANARIWPGLS